MADDEFLRYQRRMVAWVIAAILSSIGINQGIQNIAPVRYDSFTGEDARKLREDCRAYIDNKFNVHNALIPPERTRERIRYLENYLNRRFGDYTPPSYSWGHK